MPRPSIGLVLVVLVGVALSAWASFGPFLVWPGPYHWSVTPLSAAGRFGVGLLWNLVMAIAFHRDPRGRMWKLMLLNSAAGGTWVLGYVHTDLAWTLSELLGPLGAATLLHLVLAYPSGRLPDRLDRWLVALVYVLAFPAQILGFLFFDPAWTACGPSDWCPANVLLVTRNDEVVELIGRLGLLSPILALLAILETIRHWRTASPAGRRALAPVAFGMPAVFAILGIWWLAPALDRDDLRVFLLQNPIFDLPSWFTPTLFFVGMLRARLARGSLADLAVDLGRGIPLGGLRDALARTLRDPTLELAYPGPDGGGLVDPDGRPYEAPATGTRMITRLERDGEVLAVLVHDPALEREDRGFVEAVGSVARMALENERLSAQVRSQLEEVRASRLRIVEAGDAERRRVERDLHDGAQQRLVALAMRLEQARGASADARDLIDATTAELGAAIAEVRSLARGVHPPILTEAGLRAAVESLAERTPIPVEIDAADDRYPPPVEAAAYFVVAEALTNVAKYAAASHATVTFRAPDGQLMVEIRDDGRGGADPAGGSGLRGLRDRVAALGGSLAVHSPAGAGTSVVATIPLGAGDR